MVTGNQLRQMNNIESPFLCTKLSKDVSVEKDNAKLTDPRSVYDRDELDPTTRDYGHYYRQEYSGTKYYVQALRAEEAVETEALRLQAEALRVQQGAGQGHLLRAGADFHYLHFSTKMMMTTRHVLGRVLWVHLRSEED